MSEQDSGAVMFYKWYWRVTDGDADCGIFYEKFPGHVYSVCRAPRYVKREEWEAWASKVCDLLNRRAPAGAAQSCCRECGSEVGWEHAEWCKIRLLTSAVRPNVQPSDCTAVAAQDNGPVAHAKSDQSLIGRRNAPSASKVSHGEIPTGSAFPPAAGSAEVKALQSRYDELMRLCGSKAGACADALGVAGDAIAALRSAQPKQEGQTREQRERLAELRSTIGGASRDELCALLNDYDKLCSELLGEGSNK